MKHFDSITVAILSRLWLATFLFLGSSLLAQDRNDDAAQQQVNQDSTSKKTSKGRKTYMGRRIAEPMSYHGGGAEWLFRATRNAEENSESILEQLDIKPGMAICDLGCGNGFYTLPMARKVGETGKIYAVDIQLEMLQALKSLYTEAELHNIEPIQGSPDDPKLPEAALDLVLMVDVYHEFSHPEEMLAAIRRALKPDGMIALVEFRAEDPRVAIKPLHKMSKEQILKEYTANGFRLIKEFDGLPIQHLMFLGPKPAIPASSNPSPTSP